MKKLFIVALSVLTLNTYSQMDSAKCHRGSATKSLDCYFAGGISTSTGDDLKQSTWPSAELGVCFKAVSFGLNVGRFNFDKSPYAGEKIDNYYYEVKTIACFPICSIKGFVMAGWGQYKPTHSFVEFGGDIVYSVKRFDLIVQVSNWNGILNVSPGIAYNFSI
jgi:hypothetical protein